MWTCHFSKPRSLNDINIYNSLHIVAGILQGTLFPGFKYIINENTRLHLYFLLDSFYRPFLKLVNTIVKSTTNKEKRFWPHRRLCAKDAKRAFDVLVLWWELLAKLFTAIDRGLAAKIMQSVIMLHSLIVEARRDGYGSELYKLSLVAVDRGYFCDESGVNKEFKWNTQCDVLQDIVDHSGTHWATHDARVDSRMKNPVLHHVLKLNLINHIRDMHGYS